MVRMVMLLPAYLVYDNITGANDFQGHIDNEQLLLHDEVLIHVYYNSARADAYGIYMYFSTGTDQLTVCNGNMHKETWDRLYKQYNTFVDNKGKYRFRSGRV